MTSMPPSPSSRPTISLSDESLDLSIEDLAVKLELDLWLGARRDFQRRLAKAIKSAYKMGYGNAKSKSAHATKPNTPKIRQHS
jgi:hypothetical protein